MARTKGALGKKTLAKMSGQEIVKPVIKTESMGKRGRPRKEKNFNSNLAQTVIINETKIKEAVKENYITDVLKVEKLNQLKGKYILNISGENYLDAINQAKKILSDLGYQIVSYFEQSAFGRSIIVGYNKVKEVVKDIVETVSKFDESVYQLCDIIINENDENLPGFYSENDAKTMVDMLRETMGNVFSVRQNNNQVFVIC